METAGTGKCGVAFLAPTLVRSPNWPRKGQWLREKQSRNDRGANLIGR